MTKIYFKISIILLCVFLLHFQKVSAQCNSAKVFEKITKEQDRIKIAEKYNQFIENYAGHNFSKVYEFLSQNYLRGSQIKSEEEFVTLKETLYSDSQTRFVSIKLNDVDEIIDLNTWIFRGCLTEIVEGKKKKLGSSLYVWKENDSYLFSDISPVIVSLNGKTEKCK